MLGMEMFTDESIEKRKIVDLVSGADYFGEEYTCQNNLFKINEDIDFKKTLINLSEDIQETYKSVDKKIMDSISTNRINLSKDNEVISQMSEEKQKDLCDIFSERLKEEYKIERIDITEMVKPFKRLRLNEGYRLVAYACKERSGGYAFSIQIVAVKKKELEKHFDDSPLKCHELLRLRLPKCAVKPLEVLFCDGMPEGYFEVLMFEKTLKELKHLNCNYQIVFSKKDIKEQSEFIVEPKELSPKCYLDEKGNTVIAFIEVDEYGWIHFLEHKFSKNSDAVSENKEQSCLYDRKCVFVAVGDEYPIV